MDTLLNFTFLSFIDIFAKILSFNYLKTTPLHKWVLLLSVILLHGIDIFAQNADSSKQMPADSNRIEFYFPNHPFANRNYFSLDTLLHTFHQYDLRLSAYDMAATTMTTGGPLRDLFFSALSNQFSIGEQNLGEYFYQSANLPLYRNVEVPYSEIFYTLAGQQENYLKGVLASQASKRLYFGMNFNVESTEGLFANQKVSNSHFRGIVAYQTTRNRYGFQAEYIHNKFKFGENGGISFDNLYRDSSQFTREVLPINLDQATNSLKSNYYAFNQYVNIGKSSTDSTTDRFFAKAYLSSYFSKTARMYNDYQWDSGYYQFAYLDSTQSTDSSAITDFKIDFGVSNYFQNHPQYITFDFGIAYYYKMYFDGNQEFYFNYLVPHADISFDFEKLILDGGFNYQLKLNNPQSIAIGSNDMNIFGKISLPLSTVFKWTAGFNLAIQSPSISSFQTYSNHFMWTNHFTKQKQLSLRSDVMINGYFAEVAIHTVNDFLYYDTNSFPQQFTGSFQVITARFKKEFKYKKLGSTVQLMYQKSSNEQVIQLPDLTAKASIYIGFPLFKGALTMHPGVEVTYLNNYFGDAYNPALMQFYLQQSTELDRQFYVDFYINFKIKRARVFVKYQSLNTLFGSDHYFLVPHYPQQDAIIKVGLSWKFFD
jgi:hypothetical protein